MSRKEIFRSIYKLNNHFLKSFSDLEKLLPVLFFIIAALLSITKLYQNDYKLSKLQLYEQISLAYTVLNILLFFIFWLSRLFLIRHTRAFAQYFFDFFNFDNKTFSFRKSTTDFLGHTNKSQFRFATSSDADLNLITGFHKKSFLNTSWHEKEKTVREQIKSQIDKNDHSVLIFLDKTTSGSQELQPVGYTHIVPLNASNWIEFRSGAVNDIRIKADQIVSRDGKNDDTPFGILITSANLCGKIETSENYAEYAGKKVVEALAFHLHEYCKREFKDFATIPVIFQSLRPDVRKSFNDFYTGVISKDYAKIYRFDLKNSSIPDGSTGDGSKQKKEGKPVVPGFEGLVVITSALLSGLAYLISCFFKPPSLKEPTRVL